MKPSRREAEAAAARLLRPLLHESMSVSRGCEGSLRPYVDCLSSLYGGSPWAEAQSLLLSRISDDLRIARYAASRGYAFQAMTLGSSIYELAFTAAYIGHNDNRGRIWFEWANLERTPWPRKKMVEEVIGRNVSGKEGKYAFLCWGKHGNPQLQRQGVINSSADAHLIGNDPSFGNKGHFLAELALWASTWPVVMYMLAESKTCTMPELLEADFRRSILRWQKFDRRVRDAR